MKEEIVFDELQNLAHLVPVCYIPIKPKKLWGAQDKISFVIDDSSEEFNKKLDLRRDHERNEAKEVVNEM